jgi:hypothetical protein
MFGQQSKQENSGGQYLVDVTLTEDSVAIKDPKRGINIFAEGRLPDGSMKWVVLVILAMFGVQEFAI